MIPLRKFPVWVLTVASLTFYGNILAQEEYYLSLSGGALDQSDSDNVGAFTSEFVTGEVTGVSPPLTIQPGESVGFNTDFETGTSWGVAFGGKAGAMRLELEYRDTDADVDSHANVNIAGTDLSGIDAGVLIAGNDTDLGVTVAELVRDGSGQLETSRFMVNGYYDFDLGGPLTPYLGAGLGNADNDIVYAPSDTAILSGGDDGFAWQVIGGVSYVLNERLSLFADLRYFEGEDFSVSSSLLPATFEIENTSRTLDVGLRLSF